MRHRTTSGFWKAYDALPADIQEASDRSFALLKANSDHPSLQLKRVGRLWSARVNLNDRALAVEDVDALVWFWIGNHSTYERLIR